MQCRKEDGCKGRSTEEAIPLWYLARTFICAKPNKLWQLEQDGGKEKAGEQWSEGEGTVVCGGGRFRWAVVWADRQELL